MLRLPDGTYGQTSKKNAGVMRDESYEATEARRKKLSCANRRKEKRVDASRSTMQSLFRRMG